MLILTLILFLLDHDFIIVLIFMILICLILLWGHLFEVLIELEEGSRADLRHLRFRKHLVSEYLLGCELAGESQTLLCQILNCVSVHHSLRQEKLSLLCKAVSHFFHLLY